MRSCWTSARGDKSWRTRSGDCEAALTLILGRCLDDAFSWGHRWGHAARNTDISETCDPHSQVVSVKRAVLYGPAWIRTRDQRIMSPLL